MTDDATQAAALIERAQAGLLAFLMPHRRGRYRDAFMSGRNPKLAKLVNDLDQAFVVGLAAKDASSILAAVRATPDSHCVVFDWQTPRGRATRLADALARYAGTCDDVFISIKPGRLAYAASHHEDGWLMRRDARET